MLDIWVLCLRLRHGETRHLHDPTDAQQLCTKTFDVDLTTQRLLVMPPETK